MKRSWWCYFGWHVWGIAQRVRNRGGRTESMLLALFFPDDWVCERTCMTCGHTKTFEYKRGEL